MDVFKNADRAYDSFKAALKAAGIYSKQQEPACNAQQLALKWDTGASFLAGYFRRVARRNPVR